MGNVCTTAGLGIGLSAPKLKLPTALMMKETISKIAMTRAIQAKHPIPPLPSSGLFGGLGVGGRVTVRLLRLIRVGLRLRPPPPTHLAHVQAGGWFVVPVRSLCHGIASSGLFSGRRFPRLSHHLVTSVAPESLIPTQRHLRQSARRSRFSA